jgi:hypothetical protein
MYRARCNTYELFTSELHTPSRAVNLRAENLTINCKRTHDNDMDMVVERTDRTRLIAGAQLVVGVLSS